MRKYMIRVVTVCLVLLAVGSFTLGTAGSAAPSAVAIASQSVAPAQKIAPQVLADTEGGKSGSFIVLLTDQANVSAAYGIKDKDARGWYVYNALKNKADQTQGPIKALLDAQRVNYQAFWVANAIVVYNGSRAVVDQLAARNDVKLIEANRSFRGIEPPEIANITPADNPQAPNTIEWGVQNVNAPQVWAQGYTGQNIVIGNADTGMQWDHPAIKPHYRGWNGSTADHNYNWHDAIHDSTGNPCGNNSMFPCDDYGHGTHTTGTTSGDDGAGNQIGVAPGAKWIGCRNMDQGNGTPARYTECFQWFIAPTDLNGNNPNPALRPDVINNSWGCPPSEGCAAGTLQTIVENTQAAGILVEASAGNSGSACSTVTDPPAIYAASFSSAAYAINNTLASFSSRGPVTVDGSNRRKPDIGGPGVNVRSSVPTNSYANYSGTSMAGPHVVGSVALLWSARPQLERDITTTKQILENTANPNIAVTSGPTSCGGIDYHTIPNNHFGYGRVDVLAAVNSVPLATPTPAATNTPGGPTVTLTRTPTLTPSPTATPCLSANVVQNPGFETGTFPPWVVSDTIPAPMVVMTQADGTYSAFFGNISPPEPNGDGSIYQTVTVPAGGATLSYWYWPHTTDTITFDWQDAYVENSSGAILATVMHVAENDQVWKNKTFNMTPYAGQTVRIVFLVHQDGFGDETAMYVDDVTIQAPTACGTATSTATPGGPTATPTPTSTATPGGVTATPTQCAGGGYRILIAHADSSTLPTTLRSQLLAEPGVTTVDLFDAGAGTPTLAQMQQYDEVIPFSNYPFADPPTLGNNLADYQDGGGVVMPAEFSFYHNTILGRWVTGGYSPFTFSFSLQFTDSTLGVYSPSHPLMQGITTLNAHYRVAVSTVAGAIQVATYTDGLPIVSYKTTNGHTAVGVNAYLGDRPNQWSGQWGKLFVNALRWLKPSIGCTPTPGATSTPTRTNTPGGPTNTPAPPTNTPAPTSTPGEPTLTPAPTNTPGGPTNTPIVPTVTPTDCPNPFVDINGNVFYYAIHYLYCRGVVNGTDATHYSPAGTSTRAQFAKVVVLGFGLAPYTPSGGTQDFTDVPNTYWAYAYIETGFHAGILSGFDAANCTSHGATYPCYLPNLAITRGQLTKLVVLAGSYPPFTPTGGGQDFSDVPPSYVFYVDIETAYHNGIINGFPDRTFRPNNNIRRDEMAQIVYEGIIHRP